VCNISNGFIRLCSMEFCWAAISACHALLSSHMTNKDDDDDDEIKIAGTEVFHRRVLFTVWRLSSHSLSHRTHD